MYADSMTVADARELYFSNNGFSAETYSEPWVKFKVGPVPVAFPNTASRKAAVPLHDLHHIATEYDTTLVGEAEIGAWEIGAGCGRYWAAWVLNGMAASFGMFLSPRRVVRAFARGRKARSLYDRAFAEDLLAISVGELRSRLLVALR